jgi:hypothetical protein
MTNQQNKVLEEGLRPQDLKDMVWDTFEVDTFKSKMGEDPDVAVVSFCVKDRSPAKDMMEFIEKGYDFVLDSDVSAGENEYGEYTVFVELSRTPQLAENIKEILYGVKKLTDISDWKFKYHKQEKTYEATEENLREHIPSTPRLYENMMQQVRVEGLKTFFNKTLMDDLSIDGDVLTFYKPFDVKVQLKLIKEGDTETVLEGTDNTVVYDDETAAEVFWLTKVMGDYDILKTNEGFVFNNGKHSMILQRI